ncbi:hypothetical protein ACIOHE_26455 [Streptomyces sp. NPDC087851]|uniref:hypothetical protein n=1 Tax=Streptomyces sp. NPDC087851 TaxID=3365810 RepID=UPI003805967F
MCEATRKNGTQCPNPSKFIVNGLRRAAQSAVCAVHVATTVERLATFDDQRYQHSGEHAGTVFLIPEVSGE